MSSQGAHAEALLISAILRTQGMDKAHKAGIGSHLFLLHQDEFLYLEKFYDKYHKTPSKMSFKKMFPDFTVYKTDDVEEHIEQVRSEFSRASMADLLDGSVELLSQGDVTGAMKLIQDRTLSIQASIAEDPGDYDLAADALTTFDDVSARVERVQTMGRAGVPTGFPTLDDNTGGLQPGWFSVIAARLGQGKTWSLIRMACAAQLAGYTVQYWTLEQSRHQIAMRTHSFLSSEFGYDVFQTTDLMRGTGFDLLEYKKFLNDMKDTMEGKFIINDTTRGRVGSMDIAAGIERTSPDIVYIDYLTLMQMKGDGGYASVGQLSADLKTIAERYQVPIVAASQVNRSAGTETPGTEHLSSADKIGHDADLVMTMVRKSPSVMKMKLAKFRHGPDGFHWFCEFRPGSGKYIEISGAEADALVQQDNEVD